MPDYMDIGWLNTQVMEVEEDNSTMDINMPSECWDLRCSDLTMQMMVKCYMNPDSMDN